MDVVTFILLAGMVTALVYLFGNRKKFRLPDGPKGVPFLGNSLDIKKEGRPFYKHLTELSKTYGDIFTIKIGFISTPPVIVLNSHDVIFDALVTDPMKFASRSEQWSIRLFTGDGKDIFGGNPESELWKLQRRAATSGLRNFLGGCKLDGKVHSSVERGINVLSTHLNTAVDIKQYINMMVYNVINDLVFNAQFEIDDTDFRWLQDTVREMDQLFADGFLEDVIPYLEYSPIKTKSSKRALKLSKDLVDYYRIRFQEHLENYDPENINDMIDYLLHARNKASSEGDQVAETFTDEHIIYTISDIFGAGIDTSTYTLYWIFYMLARYPDVQKRVQAEIDEVLGTRLAKLADKPQMAYCEAVMFEVLRLFPVAPLVFRAPISGDSKINGYDVPKNAQVWANLYACQRDPRVWENPDDFRPERFIHEDGNVVAKPKAWMPFSVGRRVCIGENIAKQEIFLIYASLVQKFSFKFANDDLAKEPIKFDDNGFVCMSKAYELIVYERQ